MAIDWSYRNTPNDALDRFGAGFDQGMGMAQDRQKRTTLAAYGGAAMKGDEAAIGKIAGIDPQMAMNFQANASRLNAEQLAKAKETAQRIDSIIRRKDGSLIQTEQEVQHAKSLWLASGGKPEDVANVTLQSVPQLAQTAEMMRGYTPEDRARDQLGRDQFEETKRARREAAARAAGGGNDSAAGREALARKYGLDPNTDQGRAFILTGRLPREDQQTLTAGDKDAIRTADDLSEAARTGVELLSQALKMSSGSYEGWGSGTQATVVSTLGAMDPTGLVDPKRANTTLEFDNLLKQQVLPQLKAIFGGAPTEGERAILLELQGSSALPHPVRSEIIKRAIKLAERRMQYNKDKASEMRGGTYYNAPSGQLRGAPPAAPTAPTAAPKLPPPPPGSKIIE